MPALVKCHYEVLGVERNASDDVIKKSFRKLALLQHPDKNPDRIEEAKSEFQLLQQAYEVLSDPQERAWYDEHREAVLRGGLDADFEDFNIDLIPFCSSCCYKGFGDDEKSFYTVYREVFESIAAEEMEAGRDELENDELPGFGDSASCYEDVVGPFYAVWESFCTMKTFAWNDEFDTRQADNRRIARLMDKENKKLRSEARKDWNQRVRALVDFVKRKDKRVIVWKEKQEARMKEKEVALAKKIYEDKVKRSEERKKLLLSVRKENGAVVTENHLKLKELEAWVATEFGEENTEDQSEEEDITCLHCGACNKSFRSEKSYSNHERSKKHLMQVQVLKQMMETEDDMFPEKSAAEDVLESELELPENQNEPNSVTCDVEELTEEMQKTSVNEEQDESNVMEDKDQDIDSDIELPSRFVTRVKPTYSQYSDKEEVESAKNDVSESKTKPKSNNDEGKLSDKKTVVKKKRRANAADKANKVVAEDEEPRKQPPTEAELKCSVCSNVFKSRNQLFQHIKSTGHAVPLNSTADISQNHAGGTSKLKKGNKKNK